jgi:hypothetical protein
MILKHGSTTFSPFLLLFVDLFHTEFIHVLIQANIMTFLHYITLCLQWTQTYIEVREVSFNEMKAVIIWSEAERMVTSQLQLRRLLATILFFDLPIFFVSSLYQRSVLFRLTSSLRQFHLCRDGQLGVLHGG